MIQVGTILIAIDEYKTDEDEKPNLIVGKEYRVCCVGFNYNWFEIINEQRENQRFYLKKNAYMRSWNKYFKIKKTNLKTKRFNLINWISKFIK